MATGSKADEEKRGYSRDWQCRLCILISGSWVTTGVVTVGGTGRLLLLLYNVAVEGTDVVLPRRLCAGAAVGEADEEIGRS